MINQSVPLGDLGSIPGPIIPPTICNSGCPSSLQHVGERRQFLSSHSSLVDGSSVAA